MVPFYLSEASWRILRMGAIVLTICMRMLTFREELQFYFNESYFLVQKLMINKDEKIFRYIKLRISENFFKTWYSVFQHLCNFVIPMLLLLCYVHRLIAFVTVEDSLALDFSKIHGRIQSKSSEAYNRGEKFEYNLFDDTQSLSELFAQLQLKGVLTFDYYECLLSFLLFWYFFAGTFISVFSLLYYRKYAEK